jgi:hypothetical protein
VVELSEQEKELVVSTSASSRAGSVGGHDVDDAARDDGRSATRARNDDNGDRRHGQTD